MRWNIPKKENIGNERVIKKFLLFPKEIDGEKRWLETVYIKQQIENVFRRDYLMELCEGRKSYYEEIDWICKKYVNKIFFDEYQSKLYDDDLD